ncbi:MAG: helix-turn-helix transcriptional regulator [Aureispira sp.]
MSQRQIKQKEKCTDFKNLLVIVLLTILHGIKMPFMKIGENVKKLREQHGLQQKQVADVLGVDPANYNRIEKGERNITLDMLLKAAKFFGLSLDEIVYPDKQLNNIEEAVETSLIARIRSIEDLDEEDKETILNVIDAIIERKKLRTIVNNQPKPKL